MCSKSGASGFKKSQRFILKVLSLLSIFTGLQWRLRHNFSRLIVYPVTIIHGLISLILSIIYLYHLPVYPSLFVYLSIWSIIYLFCWDVVLLSHKAKFKIFKIQILWFETIFVSYLCLCSNRKSSPQFWPMDRDLPIWKIENKYQICYKVPPLSLRQAQSSLTFHLFVLIVILLYLGVFCPELNLYFWCISQTLTSTIPSSLDCKLFRNFLIPFPSQWPQGLLNLDFRVEKEHGNASLSLFLVKINSTYHAGISSVSSQHSISLILLEVPSVHWSRDLSYYITFPKKKMKTVVVGLELVRYLKIKIKLIHEFHKPTRNSFLIVVYGLL